METAIERLINLCGQMDENAQEMAIYRNRPLAEEVFNLIRVLPDYHGDEVTPYIKASLLDEMLERTEELWMPRFALKVRKYQEEMMEMLTEEEIRNIDDQYPLTIESVRFEIGRLEDYLDPSISVKDFCTKYEKFLMFDEVERSERWEEVIHDAQVAAAEEAGEHFGMGYCFGYWSALAAELQKRGIEWRSPSSMNPRVHFD